MVRMSNFEQLLHSIAKGTQILSHGTMVNQYLKDLGMARPRVARLGNFPKNIDDFR